MKKQLARIFVLVLSSVFVISNSAQDVVLDASYTNSTGELSFNYPDSWDVDENDDEIYVTAPSDEFDDVAIDFYFVTTEMEEEFGISIDDQAGLAARHFVSYIESNGLELLNLEKLGIGEHTVVLITIPEGEGATFTFIFAIVETDNGLIMVQLEAPDDEIDEVISIFYGMIESLVYEP